MTDLIDDQTAKVATRLRMCLMQSGIGFSMFDDRIKSGLSSVWIDVDGLARAAIEAMSEKLQ